MADPIPLLKVLKEGPYEASLITTYNATLAFYEDLVLPRLVNARSRLNIVLMDTGQCAQAWATPMLQPRLAGSAYTLVPMSAPGVFHPKICVLAGKNKCELLVGSHNLTLSGFGFNREVSNWVHVELGNKKPADPAALQALADTWSLLQHWLKAQGDRLPTAVHDVIGQFHRALPAFNGDQLSLASLRVLGQSPGSPPLLDQLCEALGHSPKRVVVTGAFFDQEQAFLSAIESRWPNAEIRVVIDRDTVVLGRRPHHARTVFVCSTKVWNDTAHRYLHAKALLLDFGDRIALVSGSANPSRPAWMSSERANFEAMLLRTALGEADRDIADELLSAFAAPAMTAEDLTAVSERVQERSEDRSAQSMPVCIAPVDEKGQVVIPAGASEGMTSAQAFSDVAQGGQAVPLSRDESGSCTVSLGDSFASVRWLVLSSASHRQLRVIVQHPQDVRRSNADSKRLDLMNALASLANSVSIDWQRLISLAEPVIFSDDLDVIDASPGGTYRDGSYRLKAAAYRGKRPALRGGRIGEVLDALFRRKGSYAENANGSSKEHQRVGCDARGAERLRELEAEEANVGKDDEAYVPQYEQAATDEQILAIRNSLARILSRMHRELDDLPAATDKETKQQSPRKTLTQLLVVLSLVREFRKSRLEPKWRRADGFVKSMQKCKLLNAAVARLFRHTDGMAAQLIDQDGTEPEELGQVRALLVWLAWDVGHEIRSPIPPLWTPQDQRESAWRNARLYELLPSIVGDDADTELLRESIRMTRRPSETLAADAWLDRHLELGLVVATRLDGEFKIVTSAVVGDLVRVPNTSPPTFKVVSVVTATGITVIEFEGDDGYGGRSFSPQHYR